MIFNNLFKQSLSSNKKIYFIFFGIVLFFVTIFCVNKTVSYFNSDNFSNKSVISESTTTQLRAIAGYPVRWVKSVALSSINDSANLFVIPKVATVLKISTNENTNINNAKNIKQSTNTPNSEVSRSELFKLSLLNSQSKSSQALAKRVALERDTGFWTSIKRSFQKVNSLFATVSDAISNGSISGLAKSAFVDLTLIAEQNKTTVSSSDASISSTTLLSVEYETPAPVISEAETDTGKIVEISAQDADINLNNAKTEHITNVLAFSNIPEIYKVGQEDEIKIKWQSQGDQEVPFHAYDIDGNGKLDYVEWTVPHLSDQTFEIIFIKKAFCLDTGRQISEDIYDTVKKQDNNWATIQDNEWLRFTFERPVDKTKTIDIYVKPTNPDSPATINIYRENGDQVLATVNVDKEGYYHPSMSELGDNPTDVFDFKITGGVDIDYVQDDSPVLFTAVMGGYMDDGATFGNTSPGTAGVDYPSSTDSVDLHGQQLIEGTVTVLAALSDTVGGGKLTVTDNFNGGTVTDAMLYVDSDLTGKTIDGTFSWSNPFPENYSLGAIWVTSNGILGDFAGDLTGTAPGVQLSGLGIWNDGTINDISGNVTASGWDDFIWNWNTINDISGTVTQNPFGSIIQNGGVSAIIKDISGTVNGVVFNQGTMSVTKDVNIINQGGTIHVVGGTSIDLGLITDYGGSYYLDNTFTGSLDLGGKSVTQSGGAIVMTALNDTVGGGQLTTTGNFNGGTVTVSLINNAGGNIIGGTYSVTRAYATENWGGTIALFPDTIFSGDGYIVTYDGNGNTGGNAPADQTKAYNVTLVLQNNTGSLVRTGYTFDGWNTAANGLGTSYSVGDNYTANTTTTLYAKWTDSTNPTVTVTNPPTGSYNLAGWTSLAPTFSCVDQGSGCNTGSCKYSYATSTYSSMTSIDCTAGIPAPSQGTNIILYVAAKDVAGNTGTHTYIGFNYSIAKKTSSRKNLADQASTTNAENALLNQEQVATSTEVGTSSVTTSTQIVLIPIKTVTLPVAEVKKLVLKVLPTFGGTDKDSFTFIPQISNFLFSPLPNSILSLLNKDEALKKYLSSIGISTAQNLISLIRNPIIMQSDSYSVPGIFTVSTSNNVTRTYLINDGKEGLSEEVRVASGTPMLISVLPITKGDITGIWNNGKTSDFTLNGNSAEAKVVIRSPGKYVLKTPASPLPLIINVIAPSSSENNQTPSSSGLRSLFSKVLGWFIK